MSHATHIREWCHIVVTHCYTHERIIKTYEWVVSHIPRSNNTHGLPHMQRKDNTHEQVFYTHRQAGTSELTSLRPRTRTHTYAHEHTHTHTNNQFAPYRRQKQTQRHKQTHTERQRDRETERQTDRQIDRQTNRQTHKFAPGNTHTHTHAHTK